MTTRERTEAASPLEKFEVLSDDIDALREKVDQIVNEQCVDELLEVVTLDELAERFGISCRGLKERILAVGGEVFKLGRRNVIRKIKLLAIYEKLESS